MAGSSSGVRTHIMATNMYLVRIFKETSNYTNNIFFRATIQFLTYGTNLKNQDLTMA